jgi:hypothetical protein
MPLDEIPNNSKDKRAYFKHHMLRVRKSMIKQYKGIEVKYAGDTDEANQESSPSASDGTEHQLSE